MPHIRTITLALVVAVSGCAGVQTVPVPSPEDAASRVPSRAAELPALLERGDTAAVFDVVRAELERLGAPTPATLAFRTQPVTEPLSAFNYVDHSLRLTSIPQLGEGMAYWQRWSDLVTGGAWDPKRVLSDENDAQATGSYAILGLAAHELAHAIADHVGINPGSGHAQELLADRIAVAAMLEFDRVPALARLRERYRVVVLGALLDAIPGAAQIPPSDLDTWVAETDADPSNLPGYVGLQLARQRRLFAEAAAKPEVTPRALIATQVHDAVLARVRALEAAARWLATDVTAIRAELPPSWGEDEEPVHIRGSKWQCGPKRIFRYDGDGHLILLSLGCEGGSVSRLGPTGVEDLAAWGAEAWSLDAFVGMAYIEEVAVSRGGALWLLGTIESESSEVTRLVNVTFAEGRPPMALARARVLRDFQKKERDDFLPDELGLTETDRPVLWQERSVGMSQTNHTIWWLDPQTGATTLSRTFGLSRSAGFADGALVDGVGQGYFGGTAAAADDGTVIFLDGHRGGFRALRGDHLWGLAGLLLPPSDVRARLFPERTWSGPSVIDMFAPRHARLIASGDLVFTDRQLQRESDPTFVTRTIRFVPAATSR